MDVSKENKKFSKWFKENGYQYEPETDDEAEWMLVVRYWAWKGWKERASQPNVQVGSAEVCGHELDELTMGGKVCITCNRYYPHSA